MLNKEKEVIFESDDVTEVIDKAKSMTPIITISPVRNITHLSIGLNFFITTFYIVSYNEYQLLIILLINDLVNQFFPCIFLNLSLTISAERLYARCSLAYF